MISKIWIKHFKAISCSNEIEIKPITIICGKNSSGKSSIIQSLLLLKQTLNNPSFANSELALEGDYLHYSHLSDISHRLPHANTAKIDYEFELVSDGQVLGRYGFSFRQSAASQKSRKGPYIFDIRWCEDDGVKNIIRIEKERLRLNNKLFNLISPDKEFDNKSEYELKLYHFLPEFIRCKNTNNDWSRITLAKGNILRRLSDNLYWELSDLEYLSPLRAMPQRAYLQFSGQESELEIDGSNVAQFLWLNKDKKVVLNSERITLLNGVNACLKIMGLDQEISVKRTNRILYQLTVKLHNDSKKEVPISDVGFGYSQIIPMIVRGLMSRNKALTIYEQPEIHLHPSSAGNIADILIQFSRDGKRSIVETHSADLINKLRLRIIENPELSELVNIIFVERDASNDATIRQFRFDEDGMPPEWPIGFLDESQSIAEKIICARINRK